MAISCTQKEMEERARAELEKRPHSGGLIMSLLTLEYLDCCAEEKWFEATFKVTDDVLNPLGTMHGGITSWLLDAMCAMCFRSYTGFEITPTVDARTNYLAPVKSGDTLIIRATLDRVGNLLSYISAKAWTNDRDHLAATFSATFIKLK